MNSVASQYCRFSPSMQVAGKRRKNPLAGKGDKNNRQDSDV